MPVKRLRLQPGPQRQAARSPADIVFFGGAAFGGKSFTAVYHAARPFRDPDYSAIFFRRTYRELKGPGSVWEEMGNIYPYLGGRSREGSELDWRFPSGAEIVISHMQHEKDKYGHQSKQYTRAFFEEVTHFTESQFWYIAHSRVRKRTRMTRPQVFATCNPDPDSFVRDLIDWWIGSDGYPIKERSGKLRYFVRFREQIVWGDSPNELKQKYPELWEADPDLEPRSMTFIASNIEDNKIGMEMNPAYRSQLMTMTKVERERLRFGNWDIRPVAGLYYRREWFDIVVLEPTLQERLAGYSTLRERDVVARIRAWDKAASKPTKDNPDPDWTRGVRLAKLRTGEVVIEDLKSIRGTPGEVDDLIHSTAMQDGIGTRVAMWQDVGQAGVVDVNHFVKLLAGFTVKTIVASKDKVTYAGAPSSYAEHGNMKVVRGTWNQEMFNELEAFPEGKHDDIVDAISLGFLILSGIGAVDNIPLSSNVEGRDVVHGEGFRGREGLI